MNREELKNSGLLEQYVLGLTNRKESLMIQKILEEDPEAQKDFEKLRDELDGYVINQGVKAPDDGRAPRNREDFDDLDYEVVMQMTARNHQLVKWRYGLGALCLLLLCLCGYLFRLSQNNHLDLLVEKAEHAQDETSHHLELEHALKNKPAWNEILTRTTTAGSAVVLLHHLEKQHVALLDLSHCDTLPSGHAYYVFFNDELEEDPKLVIPADNRLGLHPLSLEKATTSVQIISGNVTQASSVDGLEKTLIASISLGKLPALGGE